ncbi:MAG TPA: class I SAM-dependent methyltransferase [Lachnospiraceae bacterium]|nr:class I SAM-dependent methyltransferase [Lachnospiraceae bacterium]
MSSIDHRSTKICKQENEDAWNQLTYEAWVNKFGTPEEAAKRIANNPEKVLSVLLPKFGDVKSKKIANLMGSNGTKAVALAMLGANAAVIDFSEGNKRYAMELADSANVQIRYLMENVVDIPAKELSGDYDIVFAEIGILHYFNDLKPLFESAYKLLKKDGVFVLRDFHPVSNKLISSRGTTAKIRKHKVTGDYFSEELVESEISFAKYLNDVEVPKVYLRKWNLGEVITAIADAGFIVKNLDEEPNLSCEQYDKGIPKTFTVKAMK